MEREHERLKASIPRKVAKQEARRVAEALRIDDDEDLLTRLVGVEDAPEHVIKANQDRVRAVAVESGRYGLSQGRRHRASAWQRHVGHRVQHRTPLDPD